VEIQSSNFRHSSSLPIVFITAFSETCSNVGAKRNNESKIAIKHAEK
jgi:hypothetical protein